jgi:F-type H+-transporting ATPase subunit b
MSNLYKETLMELILGVFKKLNIDETVFYQFIVFFFLFIILKAVFFNKLQFVLELRESKTTKLEENANKKFSEAVNLSEKYQTEIDKVYFGTQETFNLKKNEILKAEKDSITKKQSELTELSDQKRKEFTTEIETRSVDILKQSETLATSLVDKIVN